MHSHDLIRPLHVAGRPHVAFGVWHNAASLTLLQIRARCSAARQLRQRYVQPLPPVAGQPAPRSSESGN